MTVRVITLGLLIGLSLATSADTLTILDGNYKQHKIRLAGIDAPERKQAYGLASRKHLASIVASQQVTVEYQKRIAMAALWGKSYLMGSMRVWNK